MADLTALKDRMAVATRRRQEEYASGQDRLLTQRRALAKHRVTIVLSGRLAGESAVRVKDEENSQ
jgi:hypothetical protein